MVNVPDATLEAVLEPPALAVPLNTPPPPAPPEPTLYNIVNPALPDTE
jgi:hypothetical protein